MAARRILFVRPFGSIRTHARCARAHLEFCLKRLKPRGELHLARGGDLCASQGSVARGVERSAVGWHPGRGTRVHGDRTGSRSKRMPTSDLALGPRRRLARGRATACNRPRQLWPSRARARGSEFAGAAGTRPRARDERGAEHGAGGRGKWATPREGGRGEWVDGGVCNTRAIDERAVESASDSLLWWQLVPAPAPSPAHFRSFFPC